jgi:hypothetical protein
VDLEIYIETECDQSKVAFCPCIGCTVNSIMDMNNIESTQFVYDTAGLSLYQRSRLRCFCIRTSRETTAVTDIPAVPNSLPVTAHYSQPGRAPTTKTLIDTLSFAPGIRPDVKHVAMPCRMRSRLELTSKNRLQQRVYRVLPKVPLKRRTKNAQRHRQLSCHGM